MPREGGKVLNFEAFRKKGGIEKVSLTPQKEEKGKKIPPGVETLKKAADHKDIENCPCVFCHLEKNGIPVTETCERIEELESKVAQGVFNSSQFQQWMNDLRTETLLDLSNRIMGLEERNVRTHPTYFRAVVRMFRDKLGQESKSFHPEL